MFEKLLQVFSKMLANNPESILKTSRDVQKKFDNSFVSAI